MSSLDSEELIPIKRAVVTGGAGFLGAAIVRQLVAAGTEVTIISRSATKAKIDPRVRAIDLDLTNAPLLSKILKGMDAVFHVAARAGVWGPKEDYYAANVAATISVLNQSLDSGVPRFIFTSSPSVCFDGTDHRNASNDLPIATNFLCAYPDTKADAEFAVRMANGELSPDRDPMAVTILRPHLIVGPGDPHIMPRLIERARSGRLRIIGDGQNEVSLTDVENAAHAHLCAAYRLHPTAACAGKAYFVGQSEPVLIWPWVSELFERIGVPVPKRAISARTAYALGSVCEFIWKKFSLSGEPPMTRFLAMQLSTSHSYDLGPIERDLGYRELVSTAEMTERIARAFSDSERR
ncbi:MAG: nucleoside-diphosphate-sugar epimerase [Planctomycetota bacterium]|jgi:nucleoside-diphosphate-sugar epimerase